MFLMRNEPADTEHHTLCSRPSSRRRFAPAGRNHSASTPSAPREPDVPASPAIPRRPSRPRSSHPPTRCRRRSAGSARLENSGPPPMVRGASAPPDTGRGRRRGPGAGSQSRATPPGSPLFIQMQRIHRQSAEAALALEGVDPVTRMRAKNRVRDAGDGKARAAQQQRLPGDDIDFDTERRELAHPRQVPRFSAALHHGEAAHEHGYAHARLAVTDRSTW